MAANADAAKEATITAAGKVTGYNGAATTHDTLDEKIGQIDAALGGKQSKLQSSPMMVLPTCISL